MTLELRSSESQTLGAIWADWKTSDQLELEASAKNVDLTGFLDTVARLRSVGLREIPQPPTLNIMMPGGLRFTIADESTIQQYCQEGDISRVPYTVMDKGRRKMKGGIDQIDLVDYGIRVKVRREVNLDKRDARVVEMIGKWKRTPKRFRYIRRYTFIGPEGSGLRFDLSVVKESERDSKGDYIGAETLQLANILKRPVKYEIECEAEHDASKRAFNDIKGFMLGVGLVLQGLQRSFVLVRRKIADEIVQLIATSTESRPGKFPGPQPATLEAKNIATDLDIKTPNIRFGNYNVTDKADGLRCLCVVSKDGLIYLVDGGMKVYATGLRLAPEHAVLYKGTVLDGEWIKKTKTGDTVSLFYAFDIFTTKEGVNVSGLPFLTPDHSANHRLAIMTETVKVLATATQTVKDVPTGHSLIISIKTFHSTGGATGYIFNDASACLDRAKGSRYNTDGLIFTPNTEPMVRSGGTWEAQFKWKPAHDNTIDFLAVPLKNKETREDEIGYKFRGDDRQMVSYKTLRLFVGGSIDGVFRDPRDAILNELPLPVAIEDENYRPVEFKPREPSDPGANICYVAVDAGASDPAGAAPGAQDMEARSNTIYCSRSRDPITENCIVEMAYHPENDPGWRWEPIRVRWDKTERFQRGELGRTMNADWVADRVWASIHNPISEDMIRTGDLADQSADELVEGKTYYNNKKASGRDNFKIRGLGKFHNKYIKSEMLLGKVLKKGDAIMDLSCGRGGDLYKWINNQVSLVVGTDAILDCLTMPKEGMYGRYLDQKIEKKGAVPPMIFVQADNTRNIRDLTALSTDLDRQIVRALYNIPGGEAAPPAAEKLRGAAAKGFNVMSCMFALHYYFRDRASVDGFLQNISDNLKIEGFFVGCCFDGDSVHNHLKDTPEGGVKSGRDKGQTIYSIRRKYPSGEEDVLPASDGGLGKAIDVFFVSIGEEHREYLVSWEYFKKRMLEIGCELLQPDELAALKLKQSTALFGDTYKSVNPKDCDMPAAAKEFSFLNRWFVFRRRTAGKLKLGAPGTLVQIPAKIKAPPAEGAADRMPDASVAAEAAAAAPQGTALGKMSKKKAAAASAALATADAAAADAETAALAAAAAAAVPVAAPIDGVRPIFKFHHAAAMKDDIKIGRKDWARYMSTFTPSRLRDRKDHTIVYPSLEAAFASERFQIGTNKAELGSTLFSVDGTIHQKYLSSEKAAVKTTTGPLSDKVKYDLIEEMGVAIRDQLKPAELKRLGAKFDEAKYNQERGTMMRFYVQQRYETDSEFKKIMDAIKSKAGRLVYYNGTRPTDLGGVVREDGSVDGQNLLGQYYMETVGLPA
jgi:hypothetical protein